MKFFGHILRTVTLALLLSAVTTLYAAEHLPIVELAGAKFYMYVAKKGDTLFGIARQFDWNDEELQAVNPSANSPLKKGKKIYYPYIDNTADNNVSAKSSQKEIDANNTDIVHRIKKGDTVYSIAKMYGITEAEIYALNPGTHKGIKAGDDLLIRKKSDSHVSDNKSGVKYYTVQWGDTLYKIARDNNVTVAAIMEANPGVTEKNFKEGSVIKIPKSGSGLNVEVVKATDTRVDSFKTHEVKKDETWSGIARVNGVDEDMLRTANPDVTNLKKNQIIAIPSLSTVTEERREVTRDPRETSDAGQKEIYDSIHNVGYADQRADIYTVKAAIVLESPSAKKDLEFVRGFLTGVDQLKHEKYKINLNVVDGSKPSISVIETLDSIKPSVVFCTYDKSLPKYLTEYAEVSRTPLVNTFDVKSEEYLNNPYMIQMLTPSSYFNEAIADNIRSKYSDYTLLLVGTPDPDDALADNLRDKWSVDNRKMLSEEMLMEYPFSDDGKYLIYGYTVKKGGISDLLQKVADIKEKFPLADVATLGRPNWIVYDESLQKELNAANTLIPARFYSDKDSEEYRRFLLHFKSLFSRDPVKSLPIYAAVGYDNSIYYIPQLAKSLGDFNSLTESIGTVQSAISPIRVSNWGGFMNPLIYMVHFTTYNTVEKNKIK